MLEAMEVESEMRGREEENYPRGSLPFAPLSLPFSTPPFKLNIAQSYSSFAPPSTPQRNTSPHPVDDLSTSF